jgi:hypothetical protein
MQQRNDDLPPDLRHRAFFLETCRRTTEAVAKAIEDARFEDPEWVERWDVVFADLLPCGSRRDVEHRAADVGRCCTGWLSPASGSHCYPPDSAIFHNLQRGPLASFACENSPPCRC